MHRFFFLSVCFVGLILHSSRAQDFVQMGLEIDGRAGYEHFGHSVSLSSDGTVVAVGANAPSWLVGATDTLSGRVRIYAWDGIQWVQRGSDLVGRAKGDAFGTSVAVSTEGNVVAVGAPGEVPIEDAGYARVYEWDGTSWIQKGSDIEGETEGGGSGVSVSLSTYGGVLAIGAAANSDVAVLAGQVRVYEWSGITWVQKGNAINGDVEAGLLGSSVSLSEDGRVVAVGAPSDKWFSSQLPGTVRIYSWEGGAWVLRENPIKGKTDYEIGCAAPLSSDGNFVAVAAPGAAQGGAVRIYEWNGAGWIQRGIDIQRESANEHIGCAVALSGDGDLVAIASHDSDPSWVRVYAWDGAGWIMRGSTVYEEAPNDDFGWSVSISSDGASVAVGAPANSGAATYAGQVRVYRYQSATVDVEPTEIPDQPAGFLLMEAYPNPFAGLTRIRVQLPEATEIRLHIHDLLGRTVAVLNESLLRPGMHAFEWDAADLNGNPVPSGLYIVRLESAGWLETRMVSLVR